MGCRSRVGSRGIDGELLRLLRRVARTGRLAPSAWLGHLLRSGGRQLGPRQQVAPARGVAQLLRALAGAGKVTFEQRVQARALAFLGRHVGDATRVGPVVQQTSGWEVAVYLSYEDCQLGTLVFTLDGELSKVK